MRDPREAIERIEAHLGGESKAPAIAILRSLVEGLLVQGAGMRPALFGHKELALPDVENLLRDSETLRFCGGDPILAPMLMRVFATTVAELHRAVSGSRVALAKVEVERTALADQFSIAVRNGKAAEARVSELEKKLVASRDELARAEAALRKGKVERDALQAKADKLTADLATAHNHLLRSSPGRKREVREAFREDARRERKAGRPAGEHIDSRVSAPMGVA